MQPCATDSQPGREGGKLCPAPSAAARGEERSVKARRRIATRRVLTIGRGGGAGVRISGKRLPFCCLLQPRRADLRSNSVLCPERSRNGSSFLKSQRERRQRQRKKKRGGGEGDAHKPSSGGKKKNHHLSASDSGSAEVARSESGPTKPEPINFKSGRII